MRLMFDPVTIAAGSSERSCPYAAGYTTYLTNMMLASTTLGKTLHEV